MIKMNHKTLLPFLIKRNSRRFFFLQCLVLFFVFVFLSGLIYWKDPLGQRKLIKYLPDNAVNLVGHSWNSSLLRYREYDSLIIGSSITRNFSPSEISKKLGWGQVAKIFTGSLSIHEAYLQLNLAIKHGFTHVLLSLDFVPFLLDPYYKTKISSFPDPDFLTYLYQDGIKKWFIYLFSYKEILPLLSGQKVIPTKSIDWETFYRLLPAEKGEKRLIEWFLTAGLADFPIKKRNLPSNYKTTIKNTLEANLLSLVRTNPDKQFYIFMPPYSVLYWKTPEVRPNSGQLWVYGAGNFSPEAFYKLKQSIAEILIPYENIHFYDFQIDWEIISDLSLYQDPIHYSSFVNSYVIDRILIPSNRITKKNLNQYLIKIKETSQNIEDYDLPFFR